MIDSNSKVCPKCSSEYAYLDGNIFICPMCNHEWDLVSQDTEEIAEQGPKVVDANGTQLFDGDTVSVIKDLKIGSSSQVVKIGTKVKAIRLVDGDHNIDCNIKGFGAMQLKSEFVKKVKD